MRMTRCLVLTTIGVVAILLFAFLATRDTSDGIDPAIRAEIMRAGDVIVNSQNRIEYVRDVCGRISSVSNGVLRRKCFNPLMDVAFASRLEMVGDVANSEAARRELGWAHTALRTLAEEVWKMQWTEGASPEEQLEPWFRLIEKMKDEEIRLKTDSGLHAPFAELARRLYRRCEEAGAFTSHGEKSRVAARLETVCSIPVSVKR